MQERAYCTCYHRVGGSVGPPKIPLVTCMSKCLNISHITHGTSKAYHSRKVLEVPRSIVVSWTEYENDLDKTRLLPLWQHVCHIDLYLVGFPLSCVLEFSPRDSSYIQSTLLCILTQNISMFLSSTVVSSDLPTYSTCYLNVPTGRLTQSHATAGSGVLVKRGCVI